MYDGINIVCLDISREQWLNNPLLNFSKIEDITTKKVKVCYTDYRGLRFIIKESSRSKTGYRLNIRGSLAVFYNNGQHNAFDFTSEMLNQTIDELELLFGLNPHTTIVTMIEVGANISCEYIGTILDSSLVYKNNMFSIEKTKKFHGKLMQLQNLTYKIYDKGLQTYNHPNIYLRIECRLNYSKEVNKYGIYVLNDLRDTSNKEKFKKLLLDFWKSIILCNKDEIQFETMRDKDKLKILEYSIPNNWVNYSTSQRQKAKAKLADLYKKFSTSSIQQDIYALLSKKIDDTNGTNGTKIQKKIRITNTDEYLYRYWRNSSSTINKFTQI